MKQIQFKDGKRNRLPGEETLRHKKAQGRQQRHSSILRAIAEMGDEGTGYKNVWLVLDGYRFLLTMDQFSAISSGYDSHVELIRTKRFGLRIAEICCKDKGSTILMNKNVTIGLRRDQALAYVAAVQTKDGKNIAWDWGTGSPDTPPQLGVPETANE